jgi:hypothetical protein
VAMRVDPHACDDACASGRGSPVTAFFRRATVPTRVVEGCGAPIATRQERPACRDFP